MELGIWLSFVKISEFRGGGGVEPPSVRHWCHVLECCKLLIFKLRKAIIAVFTSVCPSVCPIACMKHNKAPTGRIFKKFDVWVYFEDLYITIQILWTFDQNNGCCTLIRVDMYDNTVRSECRCVLRLRYIELIISIKVVVEVCLIS
jgi:hypothetical protein